MAFLPHNFLFLDFLGVEFTRRICRIRAAGRPVVNQDVVAFVCPHRPASKIKQVWARVILAQFFHGLRMGYNEHKHLVLLGKSGELCQLHLEVLIVTASVQIVMVCQLVPRVNHATIDTLLDNELEESLPDVLRCRCALLRLDE